MNKMKLYFKGVSMKKRKSIFCVSAMLIGLFTIAFLSSCSVAPSNSSGGGGSSSVSESSGSVSKNLTLSFYYIPQPLPPSPASWFTYTINNGNCTVTGFSELYFSQFFMSNQISIPPTINGYPVVYIANYAFGDKTNITYVTIPNSVTNIGYMAFENCPNLVYVTLGNQLSIMSEFTFGSCINLVAVTSLNPNPPLVNAYTFYDCNSFIRLFVWPINFTNSITYTSTNGNGWGNYLKKGPWNESNNITVLAYPLQY